MVVIFLLTEWIGKITGPGARLGVLYLNLQARSLNADRAVFGDDIDYSGHSPVNTFSVIPAR
jgi:hypothetical protein